MKELVKSIFSNATERIKNPLIGTFLMSWIVFNWKAILFLIISTDNIENRFTTLTNVMYCNNWNLLYFPLIVTSIYIFGLPYINLAIDFLLSHSTGKQSKRVHKKELNALILKEGILIANIDIETKEKEYRELKSHNETIDSLNASIKEMENNFSNERNMFKNNIEGLNHLNNNSATIIQDYYIQIKQLYYSFSRMDDSLKSLHLGKDFESIINNNFAKEMKEIRIIFDETKIFKNKLVDENYNIEISGTPVA